jgi:predicted RNase H-like HicB family nuclease
MVVELIGQRNRRTPACGDGRIRYIERVVPLGEQRMIFSIEVEEETDGRWLAEVTTLPGVLSYGVTRTDAMARVQALALRTLAEKMENGEAVPELLSVSFQAA